MKKITPPEQDQFTADHQVLYHKRHMGSVIAYTGIYPSSFSRRLNNDEVLRDHLYDTIMELYGTVMSNQSDIGREIVAIVNHYAAEYGLLEQPISILKLAIDQLRRTSRDDIKAMSRDERALTEQYSGELREVAGFVYSDSISVRNELDGSPRGVEIGAPERLLRVR